ncbi:MULTISPECIES: hypothetical protein [unclassified Methylobacterium]|jgi:hypothetical protein|uniref:hypothetical protein n=1 Tax=unclassified Methylobacterium TaxID=2615210 RepID=UPI0005B78578|nr:MULTISPECIES: hypothetical protein [unclassified Methylobacterium]SFU50765.1 hypothetical protein SAMN02799643_00972 [Methylobacterium sp. UNCCL125]
MRCIDPDTGNMLGAGPLSDEEAEAQERNEYASDAALNAYLEREAAEAQVVIGEVIDEVDGMLADLREKLIVSAMRARGFNWHQLR